MAVRPIDGNALSELDKGRKGGAAMSRLDTIDFNELIEKATKERCEITIVYEPDRTEVTIQPWKPLRYSCPYANTTQEEAQP